MLVRSLIAVAPGLPGGGKSSAAAAILRRVCAMDPASFADVDFDSMRLFHGDYRAHVDIRRTSPVSYRDLVPWFMEGTDFERTVFQTESSLMAQLLSRRISFRMEAILDKPGCFDFLQHVRLQGYRMTLVHVHCDADTAVVRAERRARTTGRWSSASFIRSRDASLRAWFFPLASYVQNECQGTVVMIDNSLQDDFQVLYHSTFGNAGVLSSFANEDLAAAYNLPSLLARYAKCVLVIMSAFLIASVC
jgi:hypothetical protein